MLPANTADVLRYLFPGAAATDWVVIDDGAAVRIAAWRLAQPQPSEADIIAASKSPEFATWLAERTDPALSAKREAKEQLASTSAQQLAHNAVTDALLDGLNECRDKLGFKPLMLADVLAAGEAKIDSAAVAEVAAMVDAKS